MRIPRIGSGNTGRLSNRVSRIGEILDLGGFRMSARRPSFVLTEHAIESKEEKWTWMHYALLL
jgi:hypothetical protein